MINVWISGAIKLFHYFVVVVFFNHYKMFISKEKKTTEQADWYSFFINIMHILWSHLSLCKCVLDHFTGQFIHVHKWNYNGHKSKIYCFLFEIWIVLKSSCKQIKSYQNQKSYNKPINNNSLNMNYSMGFKEKEYRNEKKHNNETLWMITKNKCAPCSTNKEIW